MGNIKETVKIKEKGEFAFSTSGVSSAYNTSGKGERVESIVDKNGREYKEWHDDKLKDLSEGIRVIRRTSEERDRYESRFSMITTVEVEPSACPVKIQIFDENFQKKNNMIICSDKDSYWIEVIKD